MKMHPTLQRLLDRHLPFVAFALLLHVLAFCWVAGRVLFRGLGERALPTAFIAGDGLVYDTGPARPSEAPKIEPVAPLEPKSGAPDSVPAIPITSINNITRTLPSRDGPAELLNRLPGFPSGQEAPGPRPELATKLDRGRIAGMPAWSVKPPTKMGIISGPAAKFTICVGRPANGGGAAQFLRTDGTGERIIGGSIPNLAEMLGRFSCGRIDARVEGSLLRLDDPRLLEIYPPFVFITGTADFKLTDAEIENLRSYVMLGGCVWGDNALPGRRSRFDIAFRREMKRVIPDINAPFEALAPGHPIYSDGDFRFKSPPAGLNFHREPLEAVRIDGGEAVIYSPNGYGAMWQVMCSEDLKGFDTTVMNWRDHRFLGARDILFRNVSPESVADSYRLGANVVAWLLYRHELLKRAVPF